MIKSKKKFIIIILGLLFLIIAVPRLMYPDLDHGDEYGDANVMDAGRNFAKFGFIRCRFLPTFEVQLDKPENLYTHYPTLPENINGLLRKIFKTDSLRFFRSIALFFACLDVIFWFLFLEKFTGSYSLGFLGALFYLFNPLFIFSADNLHQLAYSGFLRSLILFSFLCYIESKDRKRLLLFLLWVFIQLEFWIGLDCVIYLFLFFILYKYFFKLPKAPLSKGAIIILFSAPVFGSLLHFMQNVWYFGSFSLALKDLVNVAAERMAHSKDSSLALTFGNWWQYAIVRYFSLVLIFNYFIVSVALFFSWLSYLNLSPGAKKKVKPLLRLCILLAICGISWYIIFPSHSIAHTFVTFLARHLVPTASVFFLFLIYTVSSFIKEKNPRNVMGKAALALVTLVIVLAGILNSDLPVTKDNIKRAKDFIVFRNCLLNLRKISEGKDTVGLNYFRFPFIRYYVNRSCTPIFDRPTLENTKPLPRYFIFMPYNNQVAFELSQFLKEKYALISQCQSARFPTLFFKLKD